MCVLAAVCQKTRSEGSKQVIYLLQHQNSGLELLFKYCRKKKHPKIQGSISALLKIFATLAPAGSEADSCGFQLSSRVCVGRRPEVTTNRLTN